MVDSSPRVIEPPHPLHTEPGTSSVFLAGSIDLGSAEDWQTHVTLALAGQPVTLWNPRRKAWDASWEQSLGEPRFVEQVEWELRAQERADHIAMYFAPHSRAPITLLELGLFARSGRLVVCCPAGYWRKGNVDVVCRRYAVPTVPGLDELVAELKRRLAAG